MVVYILMTDILSYIISKYIKVKFTEAHTKNKNILFIHLFVTKNKIIFIKKFLIKNFECSLINIYLLKFISQKDVNI